MIPDSFIQDLLARVDIVDVIERYVPLKKGGANYSARCPFHNEKSPSFTVSPTKQFYYCFGCGAKGSAIGFVMEYAGLGFREAVQELASGIGLKVPEDDPSGRRPDGAKSTDKGAADLYDVMLVASDFYRAELKKSTRAIEYLKGRGLSGEIAARFRIGFAPDGWTPLANAFPDYKAKQLLDCGLVKEPDDDDPRDSRRDTGGDAGRHTAAPSSIAEEVPLQAYVGQEQGQGEADDADTGGDGADDPVADAHAGGGRDARERAGGGPQTTARDAQKPQASMQNSQKRRYDRFRDRIMFPIINQRGQIIGFGGRVLDKGEPKYLNSPETPIFDKGRELYGLPQARLAIRETGTVVVVEGYMDVVALAQMGVANCVAALGTATTPAHVQKLMKQAERIIFCFDGDTAGRKAAWRALENSLALLADDHFFGFVFLPQGEDPDSFVRANGKDAFEQLQRDATPLSRYFTEHLAADLNLETDEGRSQLLHAAKPLVLQIAAPALKLQLLKRLADLGHVTQAELEKLYEIRVVAARPTGPARLPRVPAPEPVQKALYLIALHPALAARADLDLFDRETAEGAAVHALVEWVGEMSGRPLTPAMLAEHFRGSDVEQLLAAGKIDNLHDDFNESEIEQDFDNRQTALRKKLNQAERERLQRKMGQGGLSEDEFERFHHLMREQHELPHPAKGRTLS